MSPVSGGTSSCGARPRRTGASWMRSHSRALQGRRLSQHSYANSLERERTERGLPDASFLLPNHTPALITAANRTSKHALIFLFVANMRRAAVKLHHAELSEEARQSAAGVLIAGPSRLTFALRLLLPQRESHPCKSVVSAPLLQLNKPVKPRTSWTCRAASSLSARPCSWAAPRRRPIHRRLRWKWLSNTAAHSKTIGENATGSRTHCCYRHRWQGARC